MAAFTTIDDPGSFFDTQIYAGTGAELAITGMGFQPDMNWTKDRDQTSNHVLTDAVRGATETLYPNYNNGVAGQVTYAQGLKSFDSAGYTLGTDNLWNQSSSYDYVGWNWKMGTTSGLSGGSLTPAAYSFSATAGQGIYRYTGKGSTETIAHGLGAVPKMIIVKRLGNQEWRVQHEAFGPTKYLVLDQADATQTNSLNWADTAPTSTVFTLGSSLCGTGNDMISYVFADVQGYQKCGSYEGNNNADGPFVYTGFQPEFLIQKDIDVSRAWGMFYRKSEAKLGNTIDQYLHCNTDAAEAESGSNGVDFYSNGFKFKGAGAVINAASTYLYIAFARAPLVNSSGVPVHAN